MSVRSLAVRLAMTVVTLVVFLSAMHAVFYAMPGDPVRALFGLRSPGPELIEQLRQALHLDDPYPQQLWRYLSGLATGDLGPVYRLSTSGVSATRGAVSTHVAEALPNTLRMVGVALVVQAVIGTVLTVKLARMSGRRYLALKAVVALLIAIPSFALAGLLAMVAPRFVAAASLLAGAACLAALPSAMVALVGYPLMRQTQQATFVLRATASGIPAVRVRWLHTLRPAMGMMASLMAAETGSMLTAAILVEPVLGRQGIGSLLRFAIHMRQGPMLLAVVGVSFALVAGMNLLADIVSVMLDPRVKAV